MTFIGATISSDGSELFYSNDALPTNVFRATFAAGTFTFAGPIAELNTGQDQGFPSLSGDGRELYFETTRSDGAHTDVWVATRSGPGQPFADIREVTALSVACPPAYSELRCCVALTGASFGPPS